MHIAVVDIGGNLKYYTRMDDSILLSQDISIKKARTSASFPGASDPFFSISNALFGQ